MEVPDNAGRFFWRTCPEVTSDDDYGKETLEC